MGKEYILYIDSFLPVIMPVVLEKGVPGYYAEVSDFDADQVLSESQVNAVPCLHTQFIIVRKTTF